MQNCSVCSLSVCVREIILFKGSSEPSFSVEKSEVEKEGDSGRVKGRWGAGGSLKD